VVDQEAGIARFSRPAASAHGRLREMAILSLNSPAVQSRTDSALATEIARRANDVLAEQIARRRDRFRGFAALAMQDPEAATKELQRTITGLGFVGALVNGY
jgi:predicted TIM-barrel fold metal-dependent hydrolase